MQLTLVNQKRLKKYGKLVKSKDGGTKILYLKEGVHTTLNPIKDNSSNN